MAEPGRCVLFSSAPWPHALSASVLVAPAADAGLARIAVRIRAARLDANAARAGEAGGAPVRRSAGPRTRPGNTAAAITRRTLGVARTLLLAGPTRARVTARTGIGGIAGVVAGPADADHAGPAVGVRGTDVVATRVPANSTRAAIGVRAARGQGQFVFSETLSVHRIVLEYLGAFSVLSAGCDLSASEKEESRDDECEHRDCRVALVQWISPRRESQGSTSLCESSARPLQLSRQAEARILARSRISPASCRSAPGPAGGQFDPKLYADKLVRVWNDGKQDTETGLKWVEVTICGPRPTDFAPEEQHERERTSTIRRSSRAA